MSLLVPLEVRVGDRLVTKEVSGLAFRKEAVGGLKSVSLRLSRPLDRSESAGLAYAKVLVFDARDARKVAEGRIVDLGRAAASGDGQQWDFVAFGPAQHASDKTFPYVVIDTSLSEGWRPVDNLNAPATVEQGSRPGDTTLPSPAQGILIHYPNGTAVATNDRRTTRYERILNAGMKLGGYGLTHDSGVTTGGWSVQGVTRVDGGATGETSFTATFTTTATAITRQVVTHFANGRTTLDLRATYTGAGGTVAGDTTWGWFGNFFVRALLLTKAGVEITGATYATGTVLAHEVVADLLGRHLDQFDGAQAVVDTGAAFPINQLAYSEGVDAEKVLTDLMVLEPAYRWVAGPDVTGNGYSFRWEPWPTEVRYEVSLDDGGSFPISAADLFNEVTVRYVDAQGIVCTVTRTLACPTLDNAGVVRRAAIDLGDEVGSLANAERAGDNFLADHNVPSNAGTLTISRPIRDRATGRMVRPHEIEPGELIRVRGLESQADAFNASSNDGVTVFRIWATNYTSDDNAARLELDVPSRTTVNALRSLMKNRTRKR